MRQDCLAMSKNFERKVSMPLEYRENFIVAAQVAETSSQIDRLCIERLWSSADNLDEDDEKQIKDRLSVVAKLLSLKP